MAEVPPVQQAHTEAVTTQQPMREDTSQVVPLPDIITSLQNVTLNDNNIRGLHAGDSYLQRRGVGRRSLRFTRRV